MSFIYIPQSLATKGRNGGGGAQRDSADRPPHPLRELSEQAVLETILHDGPITRPEISARTNLSKPTVSAVVRRLERAELVHTAGPRSGRPGRKPMAYVVSERAGFVVGLDIGGTNLRVGAADIYGDVIVREKQPTVKGGRSRQRLAAWRDSVAKPRSARRASFFFFGGRHKV